MLLTTPGIAIRSGVAILAEVTMFPPDCKPKQWVALTGIDPKEDQSGDKTKAKKISKAGNAYLRGALYMPAMSASTHDPLVRAFYSKLVDERKKHKVLAQVAVMRRLLHAIWGMFHYDQAFDGEKFHPLPPVEEVSGDRMAAPLPKAVTS